MTTPTAPEALRKGVVVSIKAIALLLKCAEAESEPRLSVLRRNEREQFGDGLVEGFFGTSLG